MESIISKSWLFQHLDDSDVRIVDCRFTLGQPEQGRAGYEEAHIPGAVHFDLEKDLSGPIMEHGGRHPLPDLDIFAEKIGEAGIDNDVHIVAYDDQGGAMASRFWWMMKYIGHENVSVLDSPFSNWLNEGYPVSTERAIYEKRPFIPVLKPEMKVQMEEVKEQLDSGTAIIIDSREYERFAGLTEPIDPVAGHIPGAINHFWKDNLDEKGRWKTPDEQKQRFEHLNKSDRIIVHCGSGVTACPNVLTLTELGFEHVQLYVGSWSDWCSYPDNPVERDD